MNSTAIDTRPARFLWRRLAAFVIDCLLFYIAAIVIVISLATILPWTPRLFVSTTTLCEPAGPSALAERIDREWPLGKGQRRENQICVTSTAGAPEERTFVSTLIEAGIKPGQRSITLAIDEAANPLEIEIVQIARSVLDQLLPLFLFALCSAGLVARFGATPGKMLLALRLVQDNGELLPFVSAVKRETLRILPLLVFILLGAPLSTLLLAIFGSGDILTDLIEAITVFGAPAQVILLANFLAFPLFAILWWVFPFMRWRGQTIYDRLVGCRVIRKSAHRTTATTAASAS